MTPPSAEPFASRLFLGPALRAQPDRRLVRLVREGYENAFEEIDRRYRAQLERFAASFVGSRSEDVTQDAFSKALLALRGSDNEIELRPWLYRIVRNTALNEIRDRPPTVEQLEEALEGGQSAAVEFERREEMNELMERLRALPEPQRAAIVMRELEGLSHAEIAAALGVSGGAARQAIHRARTSLRNGLGLLIPLPLLRLLFDHGAEAGGAVAASAAGGAAAAGVGGLGGAALKVGVATVLVAGSVGAGVAVEQSQHGDGRGQAAAATVAAPAVSAPATDPGPESSGSGSGEPELVEDHGGSGAEPGNDGSGGPDDGGGRDEDGRRERGDGPGPSGSVGPSGSSGSGPSISGRGSPGDHSGDGALDEGVSNSGPGSVSSGSDSDDPVSSESVSSDSGENESDFSGSGSEDSVASDSGGGSADGGDDF